MRDHGTPLGRAILAPAAARERDSRERNFPELVKAGRIPAEQAEAELAAWRAIAEILKRGETERDTSWTELHLYTSRCLLALEADLRRAAQAGSDKLPRLIERRDLVAAIHARIDWHKHLIDDANTQLRTLAAAARMVA